jgi:hypothetical protein
MEDNWYTPSRVRRLLDHYADLEAGRVPLCRNQSEHQRCCLSGKKYPETISGGNGHSESDRLEAYRLKADIDLSMKPEITPGQDQLRPLCKLEREVVRHYGIENLSCRETAHLVHEDSIQVLREYRRATRKMAINLGWVDEVAPGG